MRMRRFLSSSLPKMSDSNNNASTSAALVGFLSDPATIAGLAAIAVGTAWYLYSRAPAPAKPPVAVDNQSLELTGGEHARISHFCKNNELISYRFEDARTLYECFQRGKKESNDGDCLGWRSGPKAPYQWMRYSEVEARAVAFGAGLSKLGVEPGQDTYLGIYSLNTPNWVIVEQSTSCFSRILVPLYDTLGPDAVSYIINKATISVVACHSSKVSLLFGEAEKAPSLKMIIKLDGAVTEEERQRSNETGITIHTMEEVERLGRENPVDLFLPTPENVSTICFTSGTTAYNNALKIGDPKGGILTHGNMVCNIAAAYIQLESMFSMNKEDTHISYLPLAHTFERVVQAMVYMCGAKVGFFQGDVKLLVDDMQALKPTLFASVPRLLNRIYDKVVAGASASPIKKWLFEKALASKNAELKRGIVRQDSIWDYLVFKKVQNLLGGRVRFILSGSAPISGKVLDFLRIAVGCQVFEGYGQTECTAGCTITLAGDISTGHVGPPLPCNRIKLVDVKDMNYFASSGEGEVCIFGPNVFKGYLNDPDKTAEAIDEDGWLHTGDVGRWLPNGSLKIIDRKKHIFKLSQGEYVAPEKVEIIYSSSTLVAQAYHYGDSLKSACVSIIVPDEVVLMMWASDNSMEGSFEELCKKEDVKKMILDNITAVGKESGLRSFEQAKAIMLHSELFSVDNGLLTPTFKLKRPAAKTFFMESFVKMYSQLPS